MLITSSPRKSNRGITLIEVLVAMIVMSFGMLGVAGLQVATAKFQQGSRVRGMLAPSLSDIASRIRINSDEAGDNAATGGSFPSSYALSDTWDKQQSEMPLTVSKKCEDDGITCSAFERASYDMTAWRMRTNAALPQGAALLSGSRANGFEVTFMWLDKSLVTDGILMKAPVCSTAVEQTNINRMSQQNCCPPEASAPVGVRCNRFTFVP